MIGGTKSGGSGGGSGGGEDRSQLMQVSGMGLEFTGSIVGMVFLGWLIDSWAGTGNLWMTILGVMGIIGGGYNFVKRARVHMKRQETAYRAKQDAKDRGDAP